MARRRKTRRYGATAREHEERAKGTIREIKRLSGRLRQQLQDPPDCVHAFHLATTLAEQHGAFLIDRFESSAKTRGGESVRALLSKFEKKCVVHPRNRKASMRIHEVWR